MIKRHFERFQSWNRHDSTLRRTLVTNFVDRLDPIGNPEDGPNSRKMINEADQDYEVHSDAFSKMVGRFPDGDRKQAADRFLKVVEKLREKAAVPNGDDDYAYWFNQVRESLSGRGCEDPLAAELGKIVEEYKVPHQFVFDFIKGILRESQTTFFRDFAELETCAYLNSSATLICLSRILGDVPLSDENQSALVELGLADYLLHKLSNFVPQMDSKIYYLAHDEVQDRGLDLSDLSEPIDDDLWKDLIQFQCRRVVEKLQSVKCLAKLPGGKFKKLLNQLTCQLIVLLKKIRRWPSRNLRSKVTLTWGDALKVGLAQWMSFKVPQA